MGLISFIKWLFTRWYFYVLVILIPILVVVGPIDFVNHLTMNQIIPYSYNGPSYFEGVIFFISSCVSAIIYYLLVIFHLNTFYDKAMISNRLAYPIADIIILIALLAIIYFSYQKGYNKAKKESAK